MIKSPLISLAICSLLSLSTQAETLSESLVQCAKVNDDVERLVCFDDLSKQVNMPVSKVTQSNDTALDVSTLAEIDTVTVPAKSKAANFGAEHLKKSNVAEEDLQVVFIVAKLKQDHYGKLRFTFENGQQWKQTDSNHLNVKVGDNVLLKKGFMNAVYLKKNDVDANKKIRVKRLK